MYLTGKVGILLPHVPKVPKQAKVCMYVIPTPAINSYEVRSITV